jgi:hypothetical protein
MRAISSSVKKYFLIFFVLEERREKRNPGPFATQAIPNTNQKIKKCNGKERSERLPPREEFIITSQIVSEPSIKQRRKIIVKNK